MRPFALLLVSWLTALPAAASQDDMQSAACRDALAALQAHEAAMAAGSAPTASSGAAAADRAPPARADATWRALRAQAARSCLGGQPDAPPPPPRGATAPPISVPPVAGNAPVAPLPAQPIPAPLPARQL